MVLEFIDGQSLFEHIEDIRDYDIDLDMLTRYTILMKVAAGLTKLHDLQIIHRDSNFIFGILFIF